MKCESAKCLEKAVKFIRTPKQVIALCKFHFDYSVNSWKKLEIYNNGNISEITESDYVIMDVMEDVKV